MKVSPIIFVVHHEIITLTSLHYLALERRFIIQHRKPSRFYLYVITCHTVSDKGSYLSLYRSWLKLPLSLEMLVIHCKRWSSCSVGALTANSYPQFYFSPAYCLQLGFVKAGILFWIYKQNIKFYLGWFYCICFISRFPLRFVISIGTSEPPVTITCRFS